MSEYIIKAAEWAIDYKGESLFKGCEEIVRCRDCKHSRKDGTLCVFFAAWEPIAGGDEYAEIPADVEPDGFCSWACRKEQ